MSMTNHIRIRFVLLVSTIVAALGIAGAQQSAHPAGGPGRHARPGRAGGSADHRRHAAQRVPLLHPREPPAAGPRRASPRGQGRVGARRRRPARHGALRRAHGLQRHAELSGQCRWHVHAVARRAVRRARQRPHRLRRNGLRAADPDRQPGGARPLAAHPRRLRAQRDVRSARDRQGTRRHPRRVAPGAGRRRADPERAVSPPAQRVALRGPAADRQPRDHPHRQSRLG